MTIFFASDHAGFTLKRNLIEYIHGLGFQAIDKGPFVYDESDDYPDFISLVAREVSRNPEACRGIVIGGGGQGEAIVANRFPHVRAAVFYGPMAAQDAIDVKGQRSTDLFENVRLSRTHNDANVLSIAARFVNEEDARHAVRIFLEIRFSGEERHARRIKKIDELK
ncbi:MAG: RpiB/LacA/LacB family sugar-phosphate isomerase [Patescibacteria group bacterium]